MITKNFKLFSHSSASSSSSFSDVQNYDHYGSLLRVEIRFSAEVRDLSLLHSVQTGSRARSAYSPICSGDFVPGGEGGSGQDMNLTTHHLVQRPRMVDLYLHSPTSLHGIVLNSLRTGTSSPHFYGPQYVRYTEFEPCHQCPVPGCHSACASQG
jgi:hypothetical protein